MGFFRKCCQVVYLRPWAAVQGQRWRWPPQLGVKWPLNHRQYSRVFVWRCVRASLRGGRRISVQSFSFQSSEFVYLHNTCMILQEITHAGIQVLLYTGECFCLPACQNLHVHVHMRACVCAGHPEADRPDVRVSRLCRVMSGSLADSADLEQCTQVSSTNEPSIQRAHRESLHAAYCFNQGLHIWGAELFMPVLASDQGTWYNMQMSIEYLRWFQFVSVTRWRLTGSLHQDGAGLGNAAAARLFFVSVSQTDSDS